MTGYSRMVPTKKLGERGSQYHLQLDDAARAALASFLDLQAIDRFEVTATLRRWRGVKGLAIEGRVSADVTQSCVVSLDPVPAQIDEPFTRRFLTADVLAREVETEEILVDPEADDPPEVWDGGDIDLGAIAAEHLALALDPYPRRPGVDLAKIAPKLVADESVAPKPGQNAAGDKKPNPFAVLKDKIR
jgi:uncharacterized metal-binding protein YceD (DUF177 family)